MPKTNSLYLARVRLDVTAMLWQRQWASEHTVYRYLACDASPQVSQSYEVFVTVERSVNRAACDTCFDLVDIEQIHSRMLPLATLGQGRTALADKVAALIHQLWCENGPSQSSVRHACQDVRQILTDMGVEFGLANYPDVINDVVKATGWDKANVVESRALACLFPYALQVPGLLHILDWVIREGVQSLSFWPAWQAKAKRVLQYLHGHNHREIIKQIIRQRDTDSARGDTLSSTLKTSTGRFAKWRWRTLMGAVDDLGRVEEALVCLCLLSTDFAKDLAIRDSSSAQALRAAVADETFWHQAKAIRMVITRLMGFMQWVSGCKCHEELLRQGKAIRCAKNDPALGVAALDGQAILPHLLDMTVSGGARSGLMKAILVFDNPEACRAAYHAFYRWWAPFPTRLESRGWRWLSVRHISH